MPGWSRSGPRRPTTKWLPKLTASASRKTSPRSTGHAWPRRDRRYGSPGGRTWRPRRRCGGWRSSLDTRESEGLLTERGMVSKEPVDRGGRFDATRSDLSQRDTRALARQLFVGRLRHRTSLDLTSSGERFDHSRERGQPEDAHALDVANVRTALTKDKRWCRRGERNRMSGATASQSPPTHRRGSTTMPSSASTSSCSHSDRRLRRPPLAPPQVKTATPRRARRTPGGYEHRLGPCLGERT